MSACCDLAYKAAYEYNQYMHQYSNSSDWSLFLCRRTLISRFTFAYLQALNECAVEDFGAKMSDAMRRFVFPLFHEGSVEVLLFV